MQKMRIVVLIGLFALLASSRPGFSQNSNQEEDITRWFRDSRFGMFLTFGLYSIPGGVWEGRVAGRNMNAEWIQKQGNWPFGISAQNYQALAKQFNPTRFDADEWIREVKNAGMKYFLVTAKHHDGFALWPSKVSQYDVADATPFRRDILAELAGACKKYDIKLGFYYSHWQDWEHEGGARPPADVFHSIPRPVQVTDEQFGKYWKEKCIPQVKELMEYEPAFWWFDTWGNPEVLTDDRVDELIKTVKDIDPNCLVNSRIAMTRPGIAGRVDYISMMDNTFPDKSNPQAWETMGTMSGSWGYHKADHDWFSIRDLISKLTNNAARNGNFNLNVGAKPDGTFPAASVRRLRAIGAWLYVNGEGIYETQPNPFDRHPDWGDITMKDQGDGTTRVYCFVDQWPEDRRLQIHAFIQPERAFVLESGQELEFISWHGLTIKLPHEPIDRTVTTIVLEVDNDRFQL